MFSSRDPEFVRIAILSAEGTHGPLLRPSMEPEIVFVGAPIPPQKTRISKLSRQIYYERRLEAKNATHLAITVSCLGTRFTVTIHKQADIHTLVRTIENRLVERRTLVACLVDLTADVPLRWSDTIDDILDSTSVVGVIPMPYYSNFLPASKNSGIHSNRVVQLGSSEFTLRRMKSASFTKMPQTQSVPYRSFSSPVESAVGVPSGNRLSEICSNSILLLAFCRYAARKKILPELLFYLDTCSSGVHEDYLYPLYLDDGAPLKLNVPRETTTVDEAMDVLTGGILQWASEGFELSEEGRWCLFYKLNNSAMFSAARISLSGLMHQARRLFIDLLMTALHPHNASIFPKGERLSDETRCIILTQVLDQYFPGKQVNLETYFDRSMEEMTGVQRRRSQILVSSSTSDIARPQLLSRTSRIGELMPMEDAEKGGWTEVPLNKRDSRLFDAELEDSDTDSLSSESTLASSTVPTPDLSAIYDRRPKKLDAIRAQVNHHDNRYSVGSNGNRFSTGSYTYSNDRWSHLSQFSDPQRTVLPKKHSKVAAMLGYHSHAEFAKQAEGWQPSTVTPPSPKPLNAPSLSLPNFSIRSGEVRGDCDLESGMSRRKPAKSYSIFGEKAEMRSVSAPEGTAIPPHPVIRSASRVGLGDRNFRARSMASSSSRPVSSISSSRPTSSTSYNQSTNISARYQPDRGVSQPTPNENGGLIKRFFSGNHKETSPSSRNSSHLSLSKFPPPPTSLPLSYLPSIPKQIPMDVDALAGIGLDNEAERQRSRIRTRRKLQQILGTDIPAAVLPGTDYDSIN